MDEITNLSKEGQSSLLRAIEERKITRLGGEKSIPTDVRIIATSNLKFEEEVQNGRFRNDLYHRLNEFEIQLPILKVRIDDIPVLAKEFIKEANKDFGKKIRNISSDSMKLLLSYAWPGNIRELKHVIKRAVLLENSQEITPKALSMDDKYNNSSTTSISLKQGTSLASVINKVEKKLIIDAIDQANGNKSKAAKILKINRKTLYRKIKTLNIQEK